MTETEHADGTCSATAVESSSTSGPEASNSDGQGSSVEDYEQMFPDRYTERDEDYRKTTAAELPPPPCVENWRPKRPYDRSRGGGRGRGNRDQSDQGRRYHSDSRWPDRGQHQWRNRGYGQREEGGSGRQYREQHGDGEDRRTYYDRHQRHSGNHHRYRDHPYY